MELDTDEFKQLREALLSAFPSPNDLEQMVRFVLEVNLNHIVVPGHDTARTDGLIQWAKSQGRIQKLISGAHRENPGNHMLSAFVQEMRTKGKMTPPSLDDIPELWNFDLDSIFQRIRNARYDVPQGQSLIGFVYTGKDQSLFSSHFEVRILQDFGRHRTISYKRVPSIHPNNTVEKILRTIEFCCKENLMKGDVFCRIVVAGGKPAYVSETIGDLWERLQANFSTGFNHRLNILIFGSEGCTLPEGFIKLSPLDFDYAIIEKWIEKVVERSLLTMTDQDFLMDYIKRHCKQGGCFDTELVYFYLEQVYDVLKSLMIRGTLSSENLRRALEPTFR